MRKKLNKVYETDASGFKGKVREVFIPKTIMEVRELVAKSKRVVPRGSGSGLAGGAVPLDGEDVVISLAKLNHIGKLDKERKSIEVEAGVVLDELQNHLKKYNLEFPVNPESSPICTIGGMIATDAVGSRAIKYGRTSKWVNWIEVVDGYGNLSKKGVTELSDYSGMEGTTGIIVRASLRLEIKKIRTASLIKAESIEEIGSAVRGLKRDSAVSMIEFFDKDISEGMGLDYTYHLLVEYEDGSGDYSGRDYENLLNIRRKIFPFLSGEGYTRIEDPKILVASFEKFIKWLERRKIPSFGHVSVGIIHACLNTDQEKYIPEMMDIVKRLGGQVSGEHGIGLLKKGFVGPNDKKILINVKKRTDPLNKFNIGKLI